MVKDLVTLKSPAAVLEDKRNELKRVFNDLFMAERTYREKKSELEKKIEELKRQIYELSKEIDS